MATIQQRSNRFRAMVSHFYTRHSATFSTYEEAVTWATKTEREIKAGIIPEAKRRRPSMTDRVYPAPEFTLLTQSEIASIAKPMSPTVGVYFLVKSGVVVYVGHSLHIERRLLYHHSRRDDFDSVAVIQCDQADATNLETCYIRSLKPPLNKIASTIS
jgi:hypothetical protein